MSAAGILIDTFNWLGPLQLAVGAEDPQAGEERPLPVWSTHEVELADKKLEAVGSGEK
ncbi:MAG: hypothetical protein Q7K26_02855 [bacterium]|nr:hypothetical protein [bacterium]